MWTRLAALACWILAALPCVARDTCPTQFGGDFDPFGRFTFSLFKWSTVSFTRGAGGTAAVSADSFTGQPKIDITVSAGSTINPSTVAVVVLNNDATNSPAACGGSIDAVTYSEN